ncbi:hypothetical protein SRO_0101 [Streptomyces rochei]|nr:hypothetical protein SRO_0101 [Streptomyces rochei]
MGVYMQRKNEARTGATQQPGFSHSLFANWGLQGEIPVDGVIYAQPLYGSNLQLDHGASFNAIYVVTATNHLYCFNADTRLPVWTIHLGPHDSYEDDVYPNPDFGTHDPGRVVLVEA